MNQETSNRLLSEKEFKVVQKYEKPKEIEDEDRDIIYNLVLLHFLELGFHEGENTSLKETARLTSLGKRVVDREKIYIHPILRRLYNIYRVIA